MAKVKALLHSFNNGEASRSAMNRVDKDGIRLYAERQENLIPSVIGKAIMRAGTEYISGTPSNERPELIPFESSDDGVPDALLVMGDGTMQIIIDDEYVTRPSATSSVTNGDFNSATGWTLTISSGASADINSTISGMLFMGAYARGSTVVCTRSVSTSSAGTRHALRIVVARGPVLFRCGSSSGDDDYISETTLNEGTYSLAFTPSGTYHVWFKTASNIAAAVDSIEVESAGTLQLPTPWDEAEVQTLRYTQSEDVMFVASSSVQQYRLERRGDGENSWAVVKYKPDDGPFTTARTAQVSLKPGATRGNTTLTADSSFFSNSHVGALFRLDHDQFNATFALAGQGVYTDVWRVAGIVGSDNNDRSFSYTVSGTWSGTLSMERSLENEFDGFADANYDNGTTTTSFTTNRSVVHSGASSENNALYWYRLGFQEGDYTSGVANIAVTYKGHFGYGICRVTEITSDTVAKIEVLRDFRSTAATKDWVEGEWSTLRGFPTASEFHDGRLFWGRQGNYWGSESDNYEGFSSETVGDSKTIARTITIGASAAIRWLLSLQRLIFGVRAGEISARSSSFDAPLTATDITLKAASTQGVADIAPVRIDSRGIYVQRAGRKLYELAYSVETNDYASNNLTRLNEDIALSDYIASGASDGSIDHLAVQRQPDTHVWCTREDGVSVNFLYEPEDKVRGWWRFVTGNVSPGGDAPWDQVVSTAVLPSTGEDKVYLAVAREVNGSTLYYIEKLRPQTDAIQRTYDDDFGGIRPKNGLYMADSFWTATGNSTADQVVTGGSHLIGREVIVIGQKVDGAYGPLVDDDRELVLLTVDGSGQVTIPSAMSGDLCIGLPYRGRYKSVKLAYGAEEGSTALLQKKRVDTLGLAMLDTHPDAIRVGRSFDADDMDELPRYTGEEELRVAGDYLESEIDEPMFGFPGTWNTDSRIYIEVRPGHSATLSAVVIGVETTD